MGTAKSSNATSKPKLKAPPAIPNPFPDSPPRDYNIAAVDRTLDLLEALSRLGPASLAALAESAGCTRTAAFRLLRTLQGRGFTIQDEARGLWRLGARWSALGRAASEQGALAATAMPILAALGKATGENVYLRVRDGMESETVAIYQTDPTIRMYSEVGKRGPLHAGSSRILLAFAPEAVQTQLLAQRLNRYTPATRIDATWIAADLQRIRTRGYLITSDEVVAGAVGIAATPTVPNPMNGFQRLRLWRVQGGNPGLACYAAACVRNSLFVRWSPAIQRANSACASARRSASISAASGGSTVNSTISPSGDVQYSERQ
jgi:DNA-binding IclR family transcriptional regulator